MAINVKGLKSDGNGLVTLKIRNDGLVVATVDPKSSDVEVAPPLVTSDELTKVSANDTTAGYLEDKIVVTANLTKATLNDGADEDVQLDLADAGAGAGATGGSGDFIESITLDAKGRVTAVTAAPAGGFSDTIAPLGSPQQEMEYTGLASGTYEMFFFITGGDGSTFTVIADGSVPTEGNRDDGDGTPVFSVNTEAIGGSSDKAVVFVKIDTVAKIAVVEVSAGSSSGSILGFSRNYMHWSGGAPTDLGLRGSQASAFGIGSSSWIRKIG